MAAHQTRYLAALAAGMLLAFCVSAPASADQSDNIQVVQHIPMTLANEIEFDGSRIYVNQYASGENMGVTSFERLANGTLRETGHLVCRGITDTAALDGGFVAIGLQQGGEKCNEPPGPLSGHVGGVHLADMSRPSRPLLLGNITLPGGIHTLTRYPGKPFVYASVGGYETQAVTSRGAEYIIDVSDPDAPKVAATYSSPLNWGGCHDVTFTSIDGKVIGFCPGQGGTEIWDASDPLAPEPIGRMLLPFVQLPHQVAVSSDGKLAAISDEAYIAHGCVGGGPAGALWFYDISDLKNPQYLGFYGPSRGRSPVALPFLGTCTAHNLNFIPDTRLLVVAWYDGGTTVLDLEDPSAATVVAYYSPEDAVAMSSYWYRGRIYVADFYRGVEVLRLKL